jgi:hypothetical protein
MTSAERDQIVLTARLLRAAQTIDWLSTGLTLIAAAGIVLGHGSRIPAIATVVLGVIAKLFGVRIAFDARLFEDVAAERVSTSGLDSALGALELAPPDTAHRPWSDRCRGAKRLVLGCAGATIGQCAAIVALAVMK